MAVQITPTFEGFTSPLNSTPGMAGGASSGYGASSAGVNAQSVPPSNVDSVTTGLDFKNSGELLQQEKRPTTYGLVGLDENLLTGIRDLDIDYLRQLKLIQDQNAFNLAQQNEYRNWLERLSNTAYQRQAADLKAAGYNPALMLSSGGASVPTSGYASSASGTLSSSANGYDLKINNYILERLKHSLNQEKYRLDKNVSTSSEIRKWIESILQIVGAFASGGE